VQRTWAGSLQAGRQEGGETAVVVVSRGAGRQRESRRLGTSQVEWHHRRQEQAEGSAGVLRTEADPNRRKSHSVKQAETNPGGRGKAR